MKEQLEQELKNHRRTEVVRLLKEGALEEVPEQEKTDICNRLLALRDKNVMEILAKKLPLFWPEMLKLDYKNWNNREFVDGILTKYHKKFDWQDDAVCEEMFEIACAVENKKTVRFLMQQKRAASKYPLLATGSDALFQLVSQINVLELTGDLEMEFLVCAATSDKAEERLKVLKEKGFDLSVKNAAGKTAGDVLEERIRTGQYDKNRSGNLKRQRDRDALKYLKRLEQGIEAKEEKRPISKKTIVWIAVMAVLIVGISGSIVYQYYGDWKEAKEAEESVAQENDSAETTPDYNTDTSLVVADGDTVNIDYIGTVDGEEFENTNGAGTSLTIGSGSYIDDFEEQLIGHNVGETMTVNVTFPEDYGKAELNGKDAEFTVTINGIYEE